MARNRYNILFSADYFKRDLLLQTERKRTKENDWRDEVASDFSRPGIAVYIPAGAAAAAPNPNRIAMPGCTGQVLTVQQINLFTTLRGNNCVQNFAQWNTLNPRTERGGMLSRGTLDISSNLSVFAEVGLSTSKTFQTFQPPFIGTSNTYLNPATGLPASVPGVILASSPYAYRLNGTTPTTSAFQYVFTELGGRNADLKNDTYRFLTGLKGTFGTWDWELGAAAAENKVTRKGTNVLLSAPTIAVLNNNTYNYFNRYDPANTPVVNGLVTTTTRVSTSKLQSVDFKTTTELMQTANGPIGFALGGETRKESMSDIPDKNSRDGSIFGSGSVLVDGERRNTAFFTEVSGNIVKGVELQAAVRHENYSDFGSKNVPGVGAKWTVSPSLLVRATYSKGFRAPTLPENSKSNAVFFTTINDPVLNLRYQTSGAFIGSGTLKPETSNNYNWGFIWEPSRDSSFGVDFYKIKQKDVVQSDDLNFILNNPSLYPGQIVRSSIDNSVVSISAKYVNIASTETSGLDVEARHRFNLGEVGNLTLQANYSYVDSYKQVFTPGQDPIEGVASNALITLPRFRGTVAGTWEIGNWSMRVANRHIEGYRQTGATSLPQQTQVRGSDTQDLSVRYRGFRNLILTGSVTNLRNTNPPYDGATTNRYAASLYDLRGRYINVGAAYSFK